MICRTPEQGVCHKINRQAKFLVFSTMGPVPRERYNAKARHSAAGSHKKSKRKNSTGGVNVQDVNKEVHIPKTKEEKEIDRKERLKQQVRL